MAVTLSALRTSMLNALGVLDTEVVAADLLVNHAGRFLLNSHPWQWRLAPPIAISLVADQDYAALPADFGELVAVDGRWTDTITIVSPAELTELRSRTVGTDLVYRGAVLHEDVSGVPTPRLHLYPTPTADSDSAFRILYRRGWVTLAEDNDKAAVPTWLEPLLYDAVIRYATGIERRQVSGGPDVQMAQMKAGPLYAEAVRMDSSQQPNQGFIRGGIGEQSRIGYPGRWHTYAVAT